MTEADRMKYDALTRQLERMRAMQYAYNRKFFTLLVLSSAGVIWALRDNSVIALVLIPVGLVTTGVTSSFFLYHCDFARIHARALEARINRLLGSRMLVASELEAEYFYPHAARKLSGLIWGTKWTPFSWFTFHFSMVWMAASGWAIWQLWALLGVSTALGITLGIGVWTGFNVLMLDQWFGAAAGEKRMAEQLVAAYGPLDGDVDSR
jgi:hypothetical protein